MIDLGRAPHEKGGTARNVIEEEAAAVAREVPKPYTVPENYVPPTIGEQFRYAARRHPYYRYGTAAAVLFGCLAWYAAVSEDKAHGTLGGGGKEGRTVETAETSASGKVPG